LVIDLLHAQEEILPCSGNVSMLFCWGLRQAGAKLLVAGIVSILGFYSMPQRATAGELVIGRFSARDLTGWKEHVFAGKTDYLFASSGGRTVLAASSSKGASGYLFRKPPVTATRYPILRWSWKVSRPVAGEDPESKSGDDYAARVYVVFPGRFFWQTRAICYVWSGVMPAGTFKKSPYTSNVVNVAVASGTAAAGTWRVEERNYVEDFRRYFGADPPDPAAVGIMTDTDNTGSSVEAWYGDISFVQHN
jgi:Protein of unknown function (DUF3047)